MTGDMRKEAVTRAAASTTKVRAPLVRKWVLLGIKLLLERSSGDPDPPGDDDGGPLPLGALHLSLHHRTHVHHHPSRISNTGLLFLYILRRQNNLVKFGNS